MTILLSEIISRENRMGYDTNEENLSLVKDICKQNGIGCQKIEKATSGYTNITFFVDDKYVIKIINLFTKPEKLQKEIDFYKHIKLDFIPEYVASGKIGDKDYLIVKKLQGKSLYCVWHSLIDKQRLDVTKQIANILNSFHEHDGGFLQPKFKQTDWVQKWKDSFSLNINILNKKGFDTSFLQDFLEMKLETIFCENKPCLIYNDAHFDNFIYDEGRVYLIDFDRVLFCSIDYELLVIKMMIDDPTKFASEYTAQFVHDEDFDAIYNLFKQYAPDMFDFKYINERVFVYQFIYYLGQGYETNNLTWIGEQLNKFKQFFGYTN